MAFKVNETHLYTPRMAVKVNESHPDTIGEL